MARARGRGTTSDLIRSMLVIIIPLVIIAAFFTDLPKQYPVETVDWQPVLAKARKQADFPVLAPTNLPEGWRATEASWLRKGEPGISGNPSPRDQWQLGFLTPEDVFIGLSQTDSLRPSLVEQQSRKGVADGTSTVSGTPWNRLVSPDRRTRSLVLEDEKQVTIVVGDLPYEALDAYAATLSSD